MSKNRADRDAAISAMQEAIIAVMYMLHADPDEEGSPFSVGTSAAHAAMAALEGAGFTIERRRS